MDEIPYVPAIANLSLSDPRCNNISCTAFYAAYNYSQATVSFYRQFDYGHWLAWYYAISIFLASIVYLVNLYLNSRPALRDVKGTKPTILHKCQACRRFISYRRLSGKLSDSLGLPSLGMLIFLTANVAVLAAMSFAIRPYYREHRGYGSPPLAIRAGLMAASLTPLLIALGGKFNLITIMTGIGYEKLNVIHRWVGWMTFGLSLIHTIPFIVAPLKDGGYAALHHQFYEPGSFEYTGIAPLAILFGIVMFSIPWVRHHFYESFYWLHWFLGVAYLGLCFWHFGQEVDSWTYLWATLGLWFVTILGRSFYKNQAFRTRRSWPSSFPTRLSIVPGGVVRIDVHTPLDTTWKPGQHFYLRFPSLSPLDNHPFTIANIPSSLDKGETGVMQRATFFARPHSGFTRKIVSFARANVDTNEAVWLEGPYGGIPRDISRRCDSLILIAGGSGITACLPWLLHCTQAMAANQGALRRVKLIWIVRERAHTEWIVDELGTAKNAINGDERLELTFYVTRSSSERTQTGNSAQPAVGKGNSEERRSDDLNNGKPSKAPLPVYGTATPSSLGTFHMARPTIASLLPSVLESGRNMIIGCGPESLKVDVANAAAEAQKRVLNGIGECKEIALYTESFGWG